MDGPPPPAQPGWRYRHRWPVRLWHWANALTLWVLLTSGLMIFNAHPRLYFGQFGANFDTAWLEIGAGGTEADPHGLVTLGRHAFDSTGWLGAWHDASGAWQFTAFPGWMTLPSHYDLAGARAWHLAFAALLIVNFAGFALWGMLSGHWRRELLPRAGELAPRALWRSLRAHARLRIPRGELVRGYNPIQKLAYALVVLVALPAMIWTGLAMGPGMDAAWPWLTEAVGGRQSARSIHFIVAWGLVAFVAVHLVMVVLSGPLAQVRAMITGWMRVPDAEEQP